MRVLSEKWSLVFLGSVLGGSGSRGGDSYAFGLLGGGGVGGCGLAVQRYEFIGNDASYDAVMMFWGRSSVTNRPPPNRASRGDEGRGDEGRGFNTCQVRFVQSDLSMHLSVHKQ